jgi:hypothetical protein
VTAPAPRSEQDIRRVTVVMPARTGVPLRSVSPAERDAKAAREIAGLGSGTPLPDRRRRHIVTRPDGSLLETTALRDWLASMSPKPRVVVERLSASDPTLQSVGRRS